MRVRYLPTKNALTFEHEGGHREIPVSDAFEALISLDWDELSSRILSLSSYFEVYGDRLIRSDMRDNTELLAECPEVVLSTTPRFFWDYPTLFSAFILIENVGSYFHPEGNECCELFEFQYLMSKLQDCIAFIERNLHFLCENQASIPKISVLLGTGTIRKVEDKMLCPQACGQLFYKLVHNLLFKEEDFDRFLHLRDLERNYSVFCDDLSECLMITSPEPWINSLGDRDNAKKVGRCAEKLMYVLNDYVNHALASEDLARRESAYDYESDLGKHLFKETKMTLAETMDLLNFVSDTLQKETSAWYAYPSPETLKCELIREGYFFGYPSPNPLLKNKHPLETWEKELLLSLESEGNVYEVETFAGLILLLILLLVERKDKSLGICEICGHAFVKEEPNDKACKRPWKENRTCMWEFDRRRNKRATAIANRLSRLNDGLKKKIKRTRDALEKEFSIETYEYYLYLRSIRAFLKSQQSPYSKLGFSEQEIKKWWEKHSSLTKKDVNELFGQIREGGEPSFLWELPRSSAEGETREPVPIPFDWHGCFKEFGNHLPQSEADLLKHAAKHWRVIEREASKVISDQNKEFEPLASFFDSKDRR